MIRLKKALGFDGKPIDEIKKAKLDFIWSLIVCGSISFIFIVLGIIL